MKETGGIAVGQKRDLAVEFLLFFTKQLFENRVLYSLQWNAVKRALEQSRFDGERAVNEFRRAFEVGFPEFVPGSLRIDRSDIQEEVECSAHLGQLAVHFPYRLDRGAPPETVVMRWILRCLRAREFEEALLQRIRQRAMQSPVHQWKELTAAAAVDRIDFQSQDMNPEMRALRGRQQRAQSAWMDVLIPHDPRLR